MSIKQRIIIGALTLSATAFGSLAVHEGWMGTAAIPTKNDRCTNGFGSTFKEDGSPVKCGETITPPQAIQRSLIHIAKDEAGLKRCVTGAMHQTEYDVLLGFGYQYGVVATCKSTMVKETNVGNYAAACKAYTEYSYLTSPNKTPGWTAYKFDDSGKPIRWRFDCSTPGNKVCSGVWKRNLERQTKCLAAQ